MNKLNNSIVFPCGLSMKNRFMLAPLTNTQSFEDGILSDDEFLWLTLRAKGNFGITMSCASHVQEIGKGFPGQLGIFDNKHIDGLKRLTDEIRKYESLSVAQLHHAGMRSPEDIIGESPVCPSADEKTKSRSLSNEEVPPPIMKLLIFMSIILTLGFIILGVENFWIHIFMIWSLSSTVQLIINLLVDLNNPFVGVWVIDKAHYQGIKESIDERISKEYERS